MLFYGIQHRWLFSVRSWKTHSCVRVNALRPHLHSFESICFAHLHCEVFGGVIADVVNVVVKSINDRKFQNYCRWWSATNGTATSSDVNENISTFSLSLSLAHWRLPFSPFSSSLCSVESCKKCETNTPTNMSMQILVKHIEHNCTRAYVDPFGDGTHGIAFVSQSAENRWLQTNTTRLRSPPSVSVAWAKDLVLLVGI